MITDAELAELRRLCAARPGQHFADLAMLLIRAHEGQGAALRQARRDTAVALAAKEATRQQAHDAEMRAFETSARLEATEAMAKQYRVVYDLACALEKAIREGRGIAAAEQALLQAVAPVDPLEPVGTCNVCRRPTWDSDDIGTPCYMAGGMPCGGFFVAARAPGQEGV